MAAARAAKNRPPTPEASDTEAEAPGARDQRAPGVYSRYELGRLFEQARELVAPVRAKGQAITADLSLRLLTAIVAAKNASSQLTLSKIFKIAARVCGVSLPTVKKVWECLETNGTVFATDTSKRGRPQGQPVSEMLVSRLKEFINDRLLQGKTTTRSVIGNFAHTVFGYVPNIGFVRRIVKGAQLWYERHKPQFEYLWCTKDRLPKILRFLLLWDAALRAQAAGKAIILYTDESYCDHLTQSRRGYTHKTAPQQAQPKGTGKRVVIIHILTKDGLLCEAKLDMKTGKRIIKVREDFNSPHLVSISEPNCGVFFERCKGADYHVTADLWRRYILHAIKPFLAKHYPGMEAFLVLDNASTHYGRTDPRWSPWQSGMKKPAIVERLQALGCTELTFFRDYKGLQQGLPSAFQWTLPIDDPKVIKTAVNEKSLVVNGQAKSIAAQSKLEIPYLDELQSAAEQWLKSTPSAREVLLSDTQAYAHANGIKLIFTVPYCPKSQPIEMVWGIMKGYLGDRFNWDKNTDVIVSKLQEAIVEKGLAFNPAGNTVATNTINHAIQWVNDNMIPRVPELSYLTNPRMGQLDLNDTHKAMVQEWLQDPVGMYISGDKMEAGEEDLVGGVDRGSDAQESTE